jgi:hypothetical protein
LVLGGGRQSVSAVARTAGERYGYTDNTTYCGIKWFLTLNVVVRHKLMQEGYLQI